MVVLCIGFNSYSQMTINNTLYTPTQLVNQILISPSSGTTSSNITFQGVLNSSNRYQIGHFTATGTTLSQLGFSSGIVMSTGNTSDIPLTPGLNPQAQAQMTTGYVSCTPGEVRETSTCPTIINDVNVLAGASNYFNAAILEFDFVPVSTTVQFRYVFGSEEYTDNSGLINYQCSSYNDKFGFLISGPGISGGQGFTNDARNIARLSNGSEVSINAVNNGTVGSSGGAPNAANCLAANPNWVQNSSTAEYFGPIDGTELNGNTIALTAEQTGLTPGQTYHIKLIITDVGDAAYDAVVYLEAGSFITSIPCTPPSDPTGNTTQPDCTTPTGSINITSPTGANIQYSLDGITYQSAATFSGLAPGSYSVYAMDNTTFCVSNSTSFTVNNAPATPTVPVIGTITQPTCTVSTGSIALSGLPASGTWTVTGSPSGSATGTGTTTTISGLAAGTSYTFTVTNDLGCTSSASASGVLNAQPTTPSAPVVGTITQPTCSTPTGSVTLSGLPASGSWTVTGSPSGSLTSSGTAGTVTGLTAGASYTFTVTNADGCTSTASTLANINTVPGAPSAPLIGTITQPTCTVATGSIALSGLPASGTWTITGSPSGSATGTGTTTTTISGLAAGTSYTFTVTNDLGCTSSTSASGELNAQPATPTAPVLGAVTQPNCSITTGSVELSGLPSGAWIITDSFNGTYSGSGVNTIISGLSPNSYSFIVTEMITGCTSIASNPEAIITPLASVQEPEILNISQPNCNNTTGTIELGGLPASGNWTITGSPSGSATGTGTTTTISGLAAGTSYTFTVTNDLGCTSSASTSGVLNTQPTTPSTPVVGTVTQPDCTTPTGSVDLSGLPASETWTVTGSPSGSLTSTGTTGTVTGLTPGSSYTYTVTDNTSGCTSSASTATGTINAAPTVPTSPIVGTITQPTCTTPTGTVDLGGLPASGTWTITGSPSGSATGTGTIGSVTGLAPGASYTFTVTNASGCTSVTSTSAVINSLPAGPTAPSAGTTVQPTCAVPTGTIEVTAPIGSYSYSIDGTNFQSSTTFTGVAPGSYMITVQDDNTGCSTPSTSQVVIDPVTGAPIITVVSTTDASCNGLSDGALEISVSGGASPYTYAWTPNAGSGAILTSLAAGSYTVDVTDNTGCSSSETITINEPNAVAMNGTSSNVDCVTQSGGSITTAASGGDGNYSYTWTPNGETTASLTNVPAGSYGVTVTDGNGCSATSNYSITTTGSLPVVIDPDYSLIDQGTSVQLTATGGTNYSWTPGSTLSCSNCPNPIASPTTTTTYYLSATDDNGCTGGDTAVVELKIACGDIYVPNTFSPNGTGPAANNTLKVFGNPACVEQLVFRVFDRWGELVFETTSMSEEWNGQYKGKDMNTGIFVYTLYVLMIDGNEIDESGNVTLVR